MSSSENRLNPEYWKNRWATGNIGWHRNHVQEFMKTGWQEFLARRKSSPPSHPSSQSNVYVFFPLCGKTVDMAWMYAQTQLTPNDNITVHVVGVDVAEKSLQEFTDYFNQQCEFNPPSQQEQQQQQQMHLQEDVTQDNGGIPIYQTDDKRLQLYCCNLYDFPKYWQQQQFDFIVDRGSFEAITPSERQQYVDLMESLLSNSGLWVQETVHYDPSTHPGPPHSFENEELQQLLGEKFNMSLLEYVPSDQLYSTTMTWCNVRILILSKKIHPEPFY